MANQLTEEQKTEFKEVFALFDRNEDDVIDTSELMNVIRTMGLNPSPEELEELKKQVGVDGKDTITLEQFLDLMALRVRNTDPEEEIREIYKVFFNKSENDDITPLDIRKVMMSLGEKLSDSQLDEMMREADKDQDGKLNHEEFVNIMSMQ